MKPKWIKLMRNEHIGRVRFAKSWPRAVIHLFYFRRFFFVTHSYNIKYERESLSEQKIQQFIATLMLKICKYDWMNHALVESSFIYQLQLICYHVFGMVHSTPKLCFESSMNCHVSVLYEFLLCERNRLFRSDIHIIWREAVKLMIFRWMDDRRTFFNKRAN